MVTRGMIFVVCIYTTDNANLVCKLLKVKYNHKNQIRVFKCHVLKKMKLVGTRSSNKSSQNNMLCKDNNMNKSLVVCVKRKLFTDSSPQKENNYTSDIIVDELDIYLNENADEIKEHDFIKCNPDLLNISFQINNDCHSDIVL